MVTANSPRRAAELTRAQQHRVLALAREITANGRALEESWSARLRAAGTIAPPPLAGPSRGAHLALGGGFRIPVGAGEHLGPAGQAFFTDRVVHQGWEYLRGYGYYAADGAMHLPGRCPSAAARWQQVTQRWPGYGAHVRPLAQQVEQVPVVWYRWLAFLAFLEAVLNDLCTARWSAAYLREHEMTAQLDEAIASVSEVLAEVGWHLWNTPERARPSSWGERLLAVVADPRLAATLHAIGRRLDEQTPLWAVRAIREGDVLWQVAAAFETRWPVIGATHPHAPVLLVSEAFGAMAAGPVWRGLMTSEARCGVELTTSRMSVHEEEMGRVSATSWRTCQVEAAGRVVVHLDDSVFTGRTHAALRTALSGPVEAVYLVAMSFDVGTPFNHPEEMTAGGLEVDAHVDAIEALARQLGGHLPAATSLWARRKRHVPADGTQRAAVARVLGGSDRLLAELWSRYARQISHG